MLYPTYETHVDLKHDKEAPLTDRIYENEGQDLIADPDETPIRDRRLVTNPYDFVISSLLDQIKAGTLHLRPISSRPKFQRKYIWSNKLASRLIESILLNVPIPPCYLSQNEEFELDVIDGQQRIHSIYRFLENQFKLSTLEVLNEFNGCYFFELPSRERKKVLTYTLRCIIITNESHPEIRFDVFERLNTNTMPLNAQELRNCMYRGALIDLLDELSDHPAWLEILNRKEPDKRMQGEELILRFFAFQISGLKNYRTPQKHWLNDVAKNGRKLSERRITNLKRLWISTLAKCLIVFSPEECFRRLPLEGKRVVVNRALMDLTMFTLAKIPEEQVISIKRAFRQRYNEILRNDDFVDLITRSVDHKSRTLKRFNTWNDIVFKGLY